MIEGCFNADMLTANSIEFSRAYNEMNLIVEAAFADTSWNEYLTMRAKEAGVVRKDAAAAKVILKITGRKGSEIIKGSLFATAEDTRFHTTEDAIVEKDGTVAVKAECENTGPSGNVDPGTIIQIPYSIPGVLEVTNEAAAADGYDQESDADLKNRYLLKVRTPATSGNENHYKEWAMEVTGVGNAKVFSTWDGPNTVKIAIVNANGGIASEDLVKNTFEHIEEKRPIGAIVTVVTAKPKPIDISVKIDGVLDIKELEEKISAYFKTFSFNSGYVSVSKIGAYIISCANVTDYDNESLKLNGMKENVKLEAEELPVLGMITNDPQ
jgi:uncharacterized phage protein gp47/JayE